MLHRVVIVVGTFLIAATTALAQEPPTPIAEPSPTPKPATKRRAFDQFDLSTGPGRSSSNPRVAASTITEFVDQGTYDGIARMVRYATQIESEYRSTEGVTIDPSNHFEPYRVLSRKLPALFRITEMYRAGLLDQPVLNDPSNVALLSQNQQILVEMQMISNSTETQLTRNQPKLIPIAERYGAPTYPVEKRSLLTAMFARLNENFSRLIHQVAVRK